MCLSIMRRVQRTAENEKIGIAEGERVEGWLDGLDDI